MTVRELIENIELPRYNNKLTKGEHKNGNYNKVYVVDKKQYNYYDMKNLNDLIENNSSLLKRKITYIEPYISSCSRYGATAGIIIFIKGDNKDE